MRNCCRQGTVLRRHVLIGLGIVVVAALFVANAVAPGNRWVGATEDLVSGAAAVAAWIGVLRLAPSARRPWVFVALALTAWFVGDVVWDAYTFLGFDRPDVSLADVCYLSAYPLLTVGIISFARTYAGRVWRDSLLDGCIFAMAIAIVVWQFLVVPITATTTSWFTSTVWSAYPLAGRTCARCAGVSRARAGCAPTIDRAARRGDGDAARRRLLLFVPADGDVVRHESSRSALSAGVCLAGGRGVGGARRTCRRRAVKGSHAPGAFRTARDCPVCGRGGDRRGRHERADVFRLHRVRTRADRDGHLAVRGCDSRRKSWCNASSSSAHRTTS